MQHSFDRCHTFGRHSASTGNQDHGAVSTISSAVSIFISSFLFSAACKATKYTFVYLSVIPRLLVGMKSVSTAKQITILHFILINDRTKRDVTHFFSRNICIVFQILSRIMQFIALIFENFSCKIKMSYLDTYRDPRLDARILSKLTRQQ